MRPLITAEWMYPGSCHPKSLAGLAIVPPNKNKNIKRRDGKDNSCKMERIIHVIIM